MENETSMNAGPSRNAVSIYRAEGPMDDFPVLKAFQQYIDAEQNKARKRMVTLCVFFGAVLCAVIAVFMVMLHDISRRNQLLNDRLVEYAMKDRDRVPVVVQQPAAPAVAPAPAPETIANNAATEAALKAMTDALVAIQKQLNERNVPAQQAAPAPEAQPQPGQEAQPAVEDDIARRERLARERIRKERAQLAEERRKLAEERERKHQEEVERHRRKLYPEYYAEKEKPATPAVEQQPQPAKREISDDDIADILREAALPEEEDEKEVAPQQTPAEPEKKFDDVGDAIEYFNDNEFEIPVDVKGTSAKWRVPLD